MTFLKPELRMSLMSPPSTHFARTELEITGSAYGYKHLAPLERKTIACCTSNLNPLFLLATFTIPLPAQDQPPLYSQVLAQLLDIGDKMPGSVVFKRGVKSVENQIVVSG